MLVATLLTVVLLSVFVADLRWRRIYFVQLVVLNLLSFAWFFSDAAHLLPLVLKACWVATQLLLLFVYVRLARGRKFFSGFGMGDLLFLVAIIPLFDFPGFVLYYISGLVFSLLAGFVFPPRHDGPKRIPLAGLLSLWMIPFLFWEKTISGLTHHIFTFRV